MLIIWKIRRSITFSMLMYRKMQHKASKCANGRGEVYDREQVMKNKTHSTNTKQAEIAYHTVQGSVPKSWLNTGMHG